jgi:hypothetical protein
VILCPRVDGGRSDRCCLRSSFRPAGKASRWDLGDRRACLAYHEWRRAGANDHEAREAAVAAVQTVLPLPWQEASIEAANAVAYAIRYHPEWFWRDAQHTEKWRAKGQPEQASSSPLIHYSNTEDCCVSDRATGTWR